MRSRWEDRCTAHGGRGRTLEAEADGWQTGKGWTEVGKGGRPKGSGKQTTTQQWTQKGGRGSKGGTKGTQQPASSGKRERPSGKEWKGGGQAAAKKDVPYGKEGRETAHPTHLPKWDEGGRVVGKKTSISSS